MALQRSSPSRYLLRFRPLFDARREFSFPCDAAGRVNLDAMSEHVRVNYLFARGMIGRELQAPVVEPV